MIQILAVDFIKRNTELLRVLKGMYDNHVTLIREAKVIAEENTSLKKEVEELKNKIKELTKKYIKQ
jgi:uncharacterized protein YlxW (UPF0749 family)